MTRDELAVLIGLAANNAATTDGEWCSVKMALAAADTALAALRPKLVWEDHGPPEWTKGGWVQQIHTARLKIGTIEVATVYLDEERPRVKIGDDETVEAHQPLPALKAEIERRVLEAMGWGTEDV